MPSEVITFGEAMGHADARLSLIVADQAVAALLRGYLADESERVV